MSLFNNNKTVCMKKRRMPLWVRRVVFIVLGLLTLAAAWSQTADGVTGINQANTTIRSYFDPATNLMYAIGAVLGIAGGIHVFYKMNRGDHDTQKVAFAWFGSCIFLVVVATILKSFFGL